MIKKLKKIARRFLDITKFKKHRALFEIFLDTVPRKIQVKANGKRVGLLLDVSHYTAVPWYVITLAFLYKSRGYEPIIIWDDIPYTDKVRNNDQNRVIRKTLSSLSDDFEIIKLSDFEKHPLDQKDSKEIERLCHVYLVSRFRSSVPHEGWKPYRDKLKKTLSENLSRVKSLMAQNSFDHLVLQGGLWGNTSLFFWEAHRHGIRAATHDSGFGIIYTAVDGIAAHQPDVAKIFDLDVFGDHESLERKKILELAKQELQHRMQATEKNGGTLDDQKFQKQVYNKSNTFSCDVLIPLNVDYDAAALGKQTFFDNPFQWLMETLDFLIKNTSATIGVRQHPVERNPFYKAKHDLKLEIERAFPGNTRIRFISADEDVNTYNLIETSRLTLPLSSTTGIEAATFGKRVIIASDAYYSDFSFVEKATSKTDYFQKISQYLKNPQPQSQKQIEEALLCYFSAQVANRIFSHFTPQPPDYAQWVKKDFSNLFADTSVQSMIDTLSDGVPAVVWRMKEILAKELK
ncbi:MAG: hypothetical protein SGI74_09325 [Oligoflexia bacterium]|nr:hypothetical protein [Oligoflexia bacterium]